MDDGSAEPLEGGWPDDRVRPLRLAERRGVCAARNVGLAAARGTYVTFLDDDDELHPDMLERSVARLRSSEFPEPVSVVSGIEIVAESGRVLETRLPVSLPRGRDYHLEEPEGGSFQVHNTLVAATQLIRDIGGWDERLRAAEHDDLFLRLNARSSLDGLLEVLYRMHAHDRPRLSAELLPRARSWELTIGKHPEAFARHPRRHAEYLMKIGVTYLRAGRWAPAVAASTRAIARDPWNPSAYGWWAATLAGPPALSTYRSLRRIAPTRRRVDNGRRHVVVGAEPLASRVRRRTRPDLVSVIIPVLNESDALPAQLEALTAQTYRGRWEVVVADNGSDDGTPEVARAWRDRLPGLRVIDAGARRGINHARNAGIAAARGDFFAFCDADDVVDAGWLEALVEAADDADVVGGWLEHERLNDPVTRSWRPPHPRDQLPVVLGFLPFAVSSNCGVRAEVLRSLGGWREEYERGGTDVEMSWRAQLASYRLRFAPNAVVHYRHRASMRALAYQYYRYGRAEPQLYRDFRDRGVPRKSVAGAVRNWLWLLVHLPDFAVSPRARGVWVRRAAFSAGRIAGSIRFQVVCL